MDWEVGQTIYIVPHEKRSSPEEAVITKISRKWMTLDKSWLGPISKLDGSQKPDRGYSSSAQAWPSKDEYNNYKVRCDRWKVFKNSIAYSACPAHLSDFDLDLIIDLVQGNSRVS